MKIRAFFATVILVAAAPAFAEAGDWLVRFGGSTVMPKSDNNDTVEVDDGTMVTFNATYFFTDRWAVEVLAALPFEHDIDLDGGSRVGSTKHLPPTVSAQYHFMPGNNVRPYVGLGVNWTEFFEEDTTGALEGVDLELDRSVGLAAQVGLDIDINEAWFVNAEVRYIDIDTDPTVTLPSGDRLEIGDVEIDPWLLGINVGFRL